ncbi:MAG: alternative ribosome rescue aminoacyl-tRNA hydrolase ArfB [Mariprofundaceae bacterium]|nr:alternative ribosome rescue aminoacyl-tRNA hydrolase ArfB [Mariprofundaceae bacterium]
MLQITAQIAIADDEIEFDFIRSSGPGGQNVNKVATAVQLRFDALHSPSLPEDVRGRLIILAGSKVNSEGILTLKAQRHRTQHANKKDALHRFRALVEQAAIRPKIRLRRSVPRSVTEKRLGNKKHRSQIKRIRQKEWP